MVRGGMQPLSNFLDALSLPPDFAARPIPAQQMAAAKAIDWLRRRRPKKQNFWPALSLALIAQAEHVLEYLNVDSVEDVWSSINVEEAPDGGTRNTLNFCTESGIHPLRPRYNEAQHVIRVEMRREHPSMPGHATQAWRQYRDLITEIYRASPSERRVIADWVWQEGVLARPETIRAGARERQVRPFHLVIRDFDTGADRGGALWQAIVYGYIFADSPSLILESHAVNVGSSRAGMIGDIDGFLGGSPVLAAEAKDFAITADTVADLEDFLEDVAQFPDVDAVVFARAFDDDARATLAAAGARTVGHAEMLATVALWDIPKQQEAIRAMRYYLSRTQKRADYADRLDAFLSERGVVM